MKISNSRIFVFGIYGIFSLLVAHSDMIRTGSHPWRVKSLSAEQTAKVILEKLGDENYFALYDYVSNDVVDHYKSAIRMAKPEKIGISLDLYEVILSDLGRRYGMIFIFDQGLASIGESDRGWGDAFVRKQFKIQECRIMDEGAVVDLVAEDGNSAVLLLAKEGEFWRLKQIAFGDFIWPIGMKVRSQPVDADNPVNSPENPKIHTDD